MNSTQTRIVTTSWDDGNRADLQIAKLLTAKAMKATFYVPINYQERTMRNEELRGLASTGFEIGAHGFSHRLLQGLSTAELEKEIVPCKGSLEEITKTDIRMFCYPCGRYDSRVIEMLRSFGYRGGRTTRMLGMQAQFDNFEMPTTVQAFPHAPFTYVKNMLKGGKIEYLKTFMAQRARLGDWVALSKSLFDAVLQDGGIWHLYGHSWEIERLGLWDGLREVVDYVSRREGVHYMTNGELITAREMVNSD
jgi:peptidoglycan-N-acetylglucosamine deacetylase